MKWPSAGKPERALRALHEITSAHGMAFDDKVRALLESGCQQLKLPLGILSRVTGDRYEVVQVVSPDNAIAQGTVFELGNTYCRETLKADGVIGFEHAASSNWKNHPCYTAFRLETYLGIPVHVGDVVYGTLNFSSPAPRKSQFTATDVEILRLMGQWVGSEIYRQQSEQALKQERNRAQRYLDVAGVIMLVIGADQRVSMINRKGCELLGGREADIVGRNWFDGFLPPDDRVKVRELFTGLVSGQEGIPEYYQNRVTHPRGEERLIAWHNTLLYDDAGNITATLSSGEDITEQQQAQEQLRQREEQLRLTLENAPIGILTSRLDGRLLNVNPAFCSLLGYRAEELTGLSIEDITHPDDWEETRQAFDALVHGDIDSYELEKRYSAVTAPSSPARARRTGTGCAGQASDGGGRSRGYYPARTHREDIPAGRRVGAECHCHGQFGEPIVLVNSQTERYFGYRRDELLGKPIEVLIPERMREHHPEYVSSFKSEHRARPMGLGRDLFGLRKDGSEFPVEVGLSPVETGQELLILSAIVDISERVASTGNCSACAPISRTLSIPCPRYWSAWTRKAGLRSGTRVPRRQLACRPPRQSGNLSTRCSPNSNPSSRI